VVLRAYFDESGIHAGSKATAIAGFVGEADAFDETEARWLSACRSEGLDFFHYSHMMNRRRPFEHFDEDKRRRLLTKLSSILSEAAPYLKVVGSAYVGIWDKAPVPELAERYPSAYSFCFETLMEMLHSHAMKEFGGQRIVPIFAYQHEYEPRIREMDNIFHETGSWPYMGPVGFDEPSNRPALQMADMVLYEAYQYLSRGSRDEWQNWPYLSRIWGDNAAYENAVQFIISHNATSVRMAYQRGPVAWGIRHERPSPEEWDPG
jgi:Protein of unknown function (DUF3800)